MLVARALVVALAIGYPFRAGSAQTPHLSIAVAPAISAEAATEVPLAIRVGPAKAVPKGSFIRIRGLPPTIALSEGYSIAPGSWAVPIVALPSLKITLPAAAAGKSEMVITLVGVDGTVLVETRSILAIEPHSPPVRQTQPRREPPPASILRAGTPLDAPPSQTERIAPSVPPPGKNGMTPKQRERALRFMKRGDELLSQGGIAQARLLYQRAAEAGLADGAMAMAATYDEAELNRLGVRGLQPDRAAARQWYERARQLGATEADQRLRRLGAN